MIPDICPAEVLGDGTGGEFSLVAGDFEEIYGSKHWGPASIADRMAGVEEDEGGDVDQKRRWGAVVTCFFIDTVRRCSDRCKAIV